jgi:hypothetical protein
MAQRSENRAKAMSSSKARAERIAKHSGEKNSARIERSQKDGKFTVTVQTKMAWDGSWSSGETMHFASFGEMHNEFCARVKMFTNWGWKIEII